MYSFPLENAQNLNEIFAIKQTRDSVLRSFEGRVHSFTDHIRLLVHLLQRIHNSLHNLLPARQRCARVLNTFAILPHRNAMLVVGVHDKLCDLFVPPELAMPECPLALVFIALTFTATRLVTRALLRAGHLTASLKVLGLLA